MVLSPVCSAAATGEDAATSLARRRRGQWLAGSLHQRGRLQRLAVLSGQVNHPGRGTCCRRGLAHDAIEQSA